MTLSLTAKELNQFASVSVDNRVWDPVTRAHVWDAAAQAYVTTTDPAQIRRWVVYAIPAQLVNKHRIAIRVVPPEEYQRGRAEN